MAEVSSRILMITPRVDYIKELVKPEHQLFHHRIDSCSYNLNRHQLSEILIKNMFHYEGIGLSANQIGIWERAFCMMIDVKTEEVITCFNPKSPAGTPEYTLSANQSSPFLMALITADA